MNYPAASHRVSKARQQRENLLGASSGVWTRGAINMCIGERWLKMRVARTYISRADPVTLLAGTLFIASSKLVNVFKKV